MSRDIDVRRAADGRTLDDARSLMTEYAASLSFGHRLAHFDEEVDRFPGPYAPPAGSVLVAYVDGVPEGVVALRPVNRTDICEMKRLYVRSTGRGLGIGGKLVAALIEDAKARGYARMRLDSHAPTMAKAIELYERFGFVRIGQPPDARIDPPPEIAVDLIFMELALR